MIYEIKNDIIFVYDKSQFNPKHILECGQVFRFGIDSQNNYYVISKNHKAIIKETPNHYEILSDDADYFVHYFDLETDYTELKKEIKKNKILSPMVDFGYGIRILNGDAEEMIYSFIISQNNNIKRIQKIIENLCDISEPKNDFKPFPSTAKLSQQSFDFYKNLGAGYRDKFLKDTATACNNIDIESLKTLDTDTLYKNLISLNGVGPKVASCILLFGFSRKDKFPVDTWIEQVYYNHFSKKKLSRPEIQKYFENIFKNNSGLVQQYLFYYERNNPNKTSVLSPNSKK